ncbi:MAG: hypothetical protein ACYTGW_19355 [Planctomycetota bacterium]|jgi:hypothetical protein
MEHTKHIWRAGLLLLGLLLCVIVVRHFLIPESFGRDGYFRYDSLAEFMAKPVSYGSSTSCAECHEEQQESHDEGPHATVPCAECHGPVFKHYRDGERVGPMPKDATYRTCGNCHRKLRARPEKMPQIVIREHLEEQGVLEEGQAIPEKCCLVCHDPHTTKEPK